MRLFSSTFPAEVVPTLLHANVVFPFMFTGTTILAGSAAIEGVLKGEYTWRQVAHGEMRSRHTRLALGGFRRAHKAFGIPLDVPLRGSRALEGRLKRVLTDAQDSIVRGAEDISRGLVPDEEVDEIFKKRFARPFRPEAVAVGGVFKAAAEGLTCVEGRAAAKRLRESLRTLHAPDLTEENEAAATATLRQIKSTLSGLVNTGIAMQLPEIEASYGRKIPSAAIEEFVDKVVQAPSNLETPDDYLPM